MEDEREMEDGDCGEGCVRIGAGERERDKFEFWLELLKAINDLLFIGEREMEDGDWGEGCMEIGVGERDKVY